MREFEVWVEGLSDHEVSADTLGINFEFNFQQYGDQPWQRFDEIIEQFQPSQIRYPGGTYTETIFDISNPDATSYVNAQGQTQRLTPMTEMLRISAETGTSAAVVLPTAFALDDGAYGARGFDPAAEGLLRDYVRFLLETAEPGIITRLELGNEYAAYMTAVEYGRLIDKMLIIVQSEIDAFAASHDLPEAWQAPELAVQIFSQSTNGGLTPEQLDQRNINVLAQLSEEALSQVDAVVDHFYYDEGRNLGEVHEHSYGNMAGAVSTTTDRAAIWDEATGRDLTHVVSEWNTHHKSDVVTGLAQIPYLMALYSEMVAQGVDEMDFWSTQFHGTSLYDAAGTPMIAGQIFEAYGSQLIGTRPVEMTLETEDIGVTGFWGDGSLTLFVSSMQGFDGAFHLDLSQFEVAFQVAGAVQIGVDQSTSDGLYKGAAGYEYYTEPDVTYSYSELGDLTHGPALGYSLDLGAYETIVLELAVVPSQSDAIDPAHVAQSALLSGQYQVHSLAAVEDVVWGTNGVDLITAANGADEGWTYDLAEMSELGRAVKIDGVIGTKADDLLFGDAAANVLIGGDGQDFLHGRFGDDELFGGDGADTLFGGNGADALDGGAGTDVASYAHASAGVVVSLSAPSLNAGAAAGDTLVSIEGLTGSAHNDFLAGDDQNNTLHGGHGNDNLAGAGGDDTVYGGEGDDDIGGGLGNDVLFGGLGNDQLGAGDGNDSIYSGQGDDLASGGHGDDLVHGGDGNDQLAGSFGTDLVYGGDGDDDLGGGMGHDSLYGEAGHDSLGGGLGSDYLDGGAGDDFVAGGAGHDVLIGGDGDDVLNAGTGHDTMTGGDGRDAFVFRDFVVGDENVIQDFEVGVDVLRFHKSGLKDLDAMPFQDGWQVSDITIVKDAEGALVTYGGITVQLVGVDASDLSDESFMFV